MTNCKVCFVKFFYQCLKCQKFHLQKSTYFFRCNKLVSLVTCFAVSEEVVIPACLGEDVLLLFVAAAPPPWPLGCRLTGDDFLASSCLLLLLGVTCLGALVFKVEFGWEGGREAAGVEVGGRISEVNC